MAKHLSKIDLKSILNLIHGWPNDKLTWGDICEAAEPLVGKRPTRQSLNSHEEIVNAYQAKKTGLKTQGQREPRPSSLKVAVARNCKLESELAQVREQNRALKEMYVVWQYNTYKRGITERELNAPLPAIDRERTDREKR